MKYTVICIILYFLAKVHL